MNIPRTTCFVPPLVNSFRRLKSVSSRLEIEAASSAWKMPMPSSECSLEYPPRWMFGRCLIGYENALQTCISKQVNAADNVRAIVAAGHHDQSLISALH
jgi:hypothetical protein